MKKKNGQRDNVERKYMRRDCAVINSICGITEGLKNVFAFKVGILREKFFDAYSSANLSNDHANRYPHTANTGFTSHNRRILGNPFKIKFHDRLSITADKTNNKEAAV